MNSWFSELTGLQENPPNVAELTVVNNKLISPASEKSYDIGTFQIATLQNLKDAIRNIRLTDKNTVDIIYSDATSLHLDPSNEGASFQVASQFNFLEMPNPNITPQHGVSDYQYDHTQGPACAIACGAATIYRNYFLQHTTQQFNGLSLMETLIENEKYQYWKMKNGYALLNTCTINELNEILHKNRQFGNYLRVGIQHGAQVTLNNCTHKVTQVFCSALPISYVTKSQFAEVDPIYRKFSQVILNATYEATLIAAFINKRNTGNATVFLTRVGGGAFGNEQEWIDEAIESSLQKYSNLGLNVKLVELKK